MKLLSGTTKLEQTRNQYRQKFKGKRVKGSGTLSDERIKRRTLVQNINEAVVSRKTAECSNVANCLSYRVLFRGCQARPRMDSKAPQTRECYTHVEDLCYVRRWQIRRQWVLDESAFYREELWGTSIVFDTISETLSRLLVQESAWFFACALYRNGCAKHSRSILFKTGA